MLARYTRFLAFTTLLLLFLLFIIRGEHGDVKHAVWKYIQRGNWTTSWAFDDIYLLDQATSLGKENTAVVVRTPNSTEPNSTVVARQPKGARKPLITNEPSPYAFVFYATQDDYACSILVNIDRLVHVFRTRHRIFVLLSKDVSAPYVDALRKANATVSIEEPPKLAEGSNHYYDGCLLKLLAFKLHHVDGTVKRVLALDADQLILRNLDHVFELPAVDLAAPRAYWVRRETIASTFMLINLSDRLWDTIDKSIQTIKKDEYDMDLVNKVLGNTVMVLPGSYVALNSHWADWNMPDWFRGEEIKDMEEQGRATGVQGLVKGDQSDRIKVSRLGWAVDRWKTDYEKILDGEVDVDSSKKKVKRKEPDKPVDNDASEAADAPTSEQENKDKDQSADNAEAKLGETGQSNQENSNGADGVANDEAKPGDSGQTDEKSASAENNSGEAKKPSDAEASTSEAPQLDAAQHRNGTQSAQDPDEGSQKTEGADSEKPPEKTDLQRDNDAPKAPENQSNNSTAEVKADHQQQDKPVHEEPKPAVVEQPEQPEQPQAHEADPDSQYSTKTAIEKSTTDALLYDLHRVSHVLHFTFGGKPWQRRVDEIEKFHRTHKLFEEHWKVWREVAHKVCPERNTTVAPTMMEHASTQDAPTQDAPTQDAPTGDDEVVELLPR